MELLQLKYFCDAAKTENFSKTAKKFTVPTSNISQSVKRLEKELGAELFEHRANKITLSSTGRQFYEKISAALGLIDEARSEISYADLNIMGEVKLMIFCNRQAVTSAIERFSTLYPQVSFVIWHDKDAYADSDIVISDICPENYKVISLLADEEILLAMSKSHPLASARTLSASDLKNEHFISMTKGKSLYNVSCSICREIGFNPNISIQTDDPYYVRKYVELGLGIAFIPAFSWSGLFSDKTVLKNIGAYRRKTYICIPEKQKIKPAVSVFLKYLTEE